MISPSLIAGLNQPQREAVTAPLSHQLILAGAGSGKTQVLVSRIAYHIQEHHLSPYAILAVTFTNKAANEMKVRLNQMLSSPVLGLWVGTFHGLCHKLLRRHYREANLPEHFHILDSEDQSRIIKRVIASMNLDIERWPVKQAQAYINGNKDEGIRPQHVNVMSYGPGKIWRDIYSAYESTCQTSGVIDFAELLLRTHEMLRNTPDILNHYRQQFKAILVDEFQDTNTIQYAWIKLLAGDNAHVMVVGDDDQSIYGWRGAKVENIGQFSKDFKDTTIIRLEQNYRSTATILSAANALITHNQARMGKSLWTAGETGEKIVVFSAFNELEEARFVSDRISKMLQEGQSADEIAILYRSNAQSRLLEEALLRQGIAYRIYGGVRYFDRAEVKDTLAYLRLMINPHDDAAFERVVNFPTRGIGEKTLDELRTDAKSQSCSLWSAANLRLTSGVMAQRASSALSGFIELITRLQTETTAMELDETLNEVIQTSGLYAHFSKVKADKSESRLDNLQELINAAKQFRYDYDVAEELPIVSAFLAHASLEAGDMQALEHERFVHLMTIHAAKGLEFPVVFMVGVEEGVFPGKQSLDEPGKIEEERRLCYVGMTRAKRKLILSYAEVRRQYGREEYHRPSRFLSELPEETLDEVRVKAHFTPPARSSFSPQGQKTTRTLVEPAIPLGKNVVHPKFGSGVVLAVEGSGAHTRVQVKFHDDGVKWLVLAYAHLTIS
jgi:DNA helicase II / ATP-dependent DNA helicase PcrA